MNHAPNGYDDVGHRPILGVDVNCEQGRLQRAGAALDAAQRPPGRPGQGEPSQESLADGLGTGDEREVMHGGTRPAQAANRFVEVGRIHDRHRYHERPLGDRGGCSRSLRPSGGARMGCPGSPRCGMQPERPCAASCRCLRDPLSERRSALQQGRVRRSWGFYDHQVSEAKSWRVSWSTKERLSSSKVIGGPVADAPHPGPAGKQKTRLSDPGPCRRTGPASSSTAGAPGRGCRARGVRGRA